MTITLIEAPVFSVSRLKDRSPHKVGEAIAARYPGSTVSLSGNVGRTGYVNLQLLKVDGMARNQGTGTMIMRDLIAVADELGWNLALSPSASFGSSINRLKNFYKSFGFVENKGRNKDFLTMQSMIRRINL